MILIICFILLIFHYSNLPRKFTLIISVIMCLISFLFYLSPTSIESIPLSPLTVSSGVISPEDLPVSTTLIPQEVLTISILLLIFSPLIYKLIKNICTKLIWIKKRVALIGATGKGIDLLIKYNKLSIIILKKALF